MTTIYEYSEHLASEAAQVLFPDCESMREAAKAVVEIAIFKAVKRMVQEDNAKLKELSRETKVRFGDE